LAIQGKRGAFELEDAASQFPKIAAAASKFGLTGTTGLATLGGLTQIARRATPGGEEAATSVEQLFAQLIKKSDVIQRKTGQKVFKDKGKTQTNDLTDILVGTISGAGGNLKTLEDIFGTRGSRAISPLVSTFNRARQQATGTDAERDAIAMQALRDEIMNATNATGALAEIQRDLKDAQQDASSKITAAWENFVIQISNKALPGMLSALESFSTFVDQTDFSGLGEAIAGLAKVVVAAATAIGLIAPKSAKEQQIEAAGAEVEAIQKANKAREAKGLLQSTIAGRATFEKGKLVPGEATPQEAATLRVLDESIKLGEETAATEGARATSAKRFAGVPSSAFLGVTPEKLQGVEGLSTFQAAGGGGQTGAIEKIANDALRGLGTQFKKVDVPLDNFATAVAAATQVLEELSRQKPTATALVVE
jgi:hypothetical protein